MKLFKITTLRMQAFKAREEGSVTLEAVLWFPLYALMIVFILDISMIFSNTARIQRMVQDGTRAFSYGGIQNCTDLETWLEARISPMAPTVSATCDDTSVTNMVLTQVTVRSGEIDLSGTTGRIANFDIGISIDHMVEL